MKPRHEELNDKLSEAAKYLQGSERLCDDDASGAALVRQREHVEKVRDHLAEISDAALLLTADEALVNLARDLEQAGNGLPEHARDALEHAAGIVGSAIGEDGDS